MTKLTIIKDYREGKTNHRGMTETLAKLSKIYYWPNLQKSVQNYINTCDICKQVKYDRKPLKLKFNITPTPSEPFEIIHMEVLKYGHAKLLTVVDAFTKCAQAYVLKSSHAIDIAENLLHYFSHHGTPDLIIADNGPEFDNGLINEFLTLHKIKIHFTTPGHARSHGVIERLHLTLGEHMRLLEKSKRIKGPETVARATLAYNRTIHSATNKTPIELMRAWCRIERDLPIEEDMGAIADRIRDEKLERTEKINKQKEYRKPRELKPGMKVFIKNLIRRRKSDPLYIGPYIVREVLSRHRVILGKETWSRNKSIIRHLEEVRVRARKSKECK
ncbi:hypothetical protein AAG570_007046 [Ranatra chinensis]|uniref:RNA-directed DNA polymerase n=1 Tax=Ranatra chinensis TaxID=642074 RepID=A0ABD0XXE5_9HEMI